MNFSLLIVIILATACGVKGPPRAPQDATVPALEENYPELKVKPGTIQNIKAP